MDLADLAGDRGVHKTHEVGHLLDALGREVEVGVGREEYRGVELDAVAA
jgi:hypothetical protein